MSGVELGALDSFANLGDMLASSDPIETDGRPKEIPLDKIQRDEEQPRTIFDPVVLQELADNIRENGVIQPIGVYGPDENGMYTIVFGERRWRASQLAGKTTISCVLRDKQDQYVQAAENIHKDDFKLIELVNFIQKRMVKHGESMTYIAKKMSKPLSFVSKHAALIDWPPYIAAIHEKWNVTDAETLYLLVTLAKESPDEVEAFCKSAAAPEHVGRAAVKALKAKIQVAKVGQQHQKDREQSGGAVESQGAEPKSQATQTSPAPAEPTLQPEPMPQATSSKQSKPRILVKAFCKEGYLALDPSCEYGMVRVEFKDGEEVMLAENIEVLAVVIE